MKITLFILMLLVLAYALRQRQRRRWAERVMSGRSAATAYVNHSFLVCSVGERDDDDSPVVITLLHPDFSGFKQPILVVTELHPDFLMSTALDEGDRIMLKYNPDGWKWGSEALFSQD
ncbi:MAG: hypothetical protein JNK33_04970, partial [Candidatus Doudnabacteria bacterium]|nr:hypothetical protein [Candidatus Doudnabacteria bacterium]